MEEVEEEVVKERERGEEGKCYDRFVFEILLLKLPLFFAILLKDIGYLE